MKERWLPVPDYEGRYEVSDLGRLRSLPRTEMSAKGARKVTGGLLSPSINADGYPHVSLRKNGKLRLVTVHRLVALAFVPGRNELHRQVAHLDGIRANSRAENLKWVSKGENEFHKRAHGTRPKGEIHYRARLTEAAVREIRARPGVRKELAEKFGVSPRAIDSVRSGRNWRHV